MLTTLSRRALQAVIQPIKRDPAYILDPGLSLMDLLGELGYRGTALLRAQWFLLGVKGSRLRFVESGCSIRHRRYLTIGRGSILEHGARFKCLSRDGIVLGERITVGKYALIECTGVLWHLGRGLTVGDDSSIGDYSFIGCAGGVSIGRNVLMGQYVSFHSQNHVFDEPGVAIQRQGVRENGIVVGDNCWLGAASKVLDGVTLGEGSVVAAGAVVNRSFPPRSVVGGVPARLIRHRDDELGE